jgi:hypothetical protein
MQSQAHHKARTHFPGTPPAQEHDPLHADPPLFLDDIEQAGAPAGILATTVLPDASSIPDWSKTIPCENCRTALMPNLTRCPVCGEEVKPSTNPPILENLIKASPTASKQTAVPAPLRIFKRASQVRAKRSGRRAVFYWTAGLAFIAVSATVASFLLWP